MSDTQRDAGLDGCCVHNILIGDNCGHCYMAFLERRIVELEMDAPAYPTSDAYEAACAALEKSKARVRELEEDDNRKWEMMNADGVVLDRYLKALERIAGFDRDQEGLSAEMNRIATEALKGGEDE